MGTSRKRGLATVAPGDGDPRRGHATVLVVDDEPSFHKLIARHLRGRRVLHAHNAWQAYEVLERHHVDVVLLDLNLPDANGFEVLERLRCDNTDVAVIVVTAHSELRNAVKATKAGAFDFMAKSYEAYQQVGQYVDRALEHRRWRREQRDAAAGKQWLLDAYERLEAARAPEMRAAVGLARQVAATPLTVLIEGESGVGKEVFARYVHARSDRAAGPLRAVNLAAVPPALLESHLFGHVRGAFTGADSNHVGKFESADGGTIFLDEIGELTPSAQVKLLRVLQEREVERVGAGEAVSVDVRVIAATNKDLEREVEGGRFREDLFYRLNVVRVRVPALRERAEDIPELIELFARKHALVMHRECPSFEPATLDALCDYDWPGNVRELENLVMRLVALHPGGEIRPEDIPPEYCLPTLNRDAAQALAAEQAFAGAGGKGAGKGGKGGRGGERRPYFLARDQFERYLVRLVLKRCGGDRRAAAATLGVSLTTIKDKLRE